MAPALPVTPPPSHGAQWDPSKPSCACAHAHRLTDRLLRTSARLALPFPTCCAVSALFSGRKGGTLPGAPAGPGMALAVLSAPAAVAVPPGSARVGAGAHLTYLCLPHPGSAPGTHEALERLLNEDQCRPGPQHGRNGACPALLAVSVKSCLQWLLTFPIHTPFPMPTRLLPLSPFPGHHQWPPGATVLVPSSSDLSITGMYCPLGLGSSSLLPWLLCLLCLALRPGGWSLTKAVGCHLGPSALTTV